MATARTRTVLVLASVALLVLSGCSEADHDKPLDGGYPIDRDTRGPEVEKDLAADRCRRRERGGWHYSIGHCQEMLAPERVRGVWFSGFEEESFFPGAAAIPDQRDPRRYRVTLEVDEGRVHELARVKTLGPGDHAFALTLIATRTKYPYHIDCEGGRYHTFVAHEVASARYLGPVANPDRPPPPSELPPYRPFKRSGEGGVIAELEERALALCSGSD